MLFLLIPSHATLAHLFSHGDIEEATFILDETFIRLWGLGVFQHGHDAIYLLCHLPYRCGWARAAACLLWRAGRHRMGRDQRPDHWALERPYPHALGTAATVSIGVCHSIWVQFHHALVCAKLGESDRSPDLRNAIVHAGGYAPDSRRRPFPFADPGINVRLR